MENPRQFASLDASDAALHGSLTNRPASGVPAGDPIDFEAISARVRYERTLPNYEYKESPAEIALRLERQAAAEQRIRAETADTNEKNRLMLEREQAQRNELRNRISGSEVVEAEFVQPTRRESPLAQIQRSTPERQPLPSTGSPPPTPKGTAAYADPLVEPTALPRSATIREAIGNTIGGIGQSLPKSLPQAAGRLAIPGLSTGLTFAGALIAGQSVQQAATTAVAVTAGGYAGGLIGAAVGGPIGFYVGSMIGGFVGGQLAGAFFPQPLPSTAAHLESFTPNYAPFKGGQSEGGIYQVQAQYSTTFNGNPGDEQVVSVQVVGPIESIGIANFPGVGSPGVDIIAKDADGNSKVYHQGSGFYPATVPYNLRNIQITHIGGTPDTPADIQVSSPPASNAPAQLVQNPINITNIISSGVPGGGIRRGEIREIAPAPSKPSNNTPNGAPYFPGHGGLAPSYLPNPEHQPSNLGGMLPAIKNAPQPLPFAEAEDIPVPRVSPISEGTATTTATNPSTFAYPPYVPQTAQPIPISDGNSPVPKAKAQPIPKTPEQVATDKTNETIEKQKKDFDEQIKRLTAIATGLAALTPAIQGIPDAIAKSPTVQAANKETTQGAVCEIAQPGKCLGKAIDDSAEKINQNNNQNTANLLDKINAGANAAQLALLELINTKLGDLLPGGLSGTFTRLWQTLQVDRILNILILITTFHNALMLSNNLAQTLFAAIDNISQAVGFKWKNEKGEESGFASIMSEWTADFFKAIFGEENYTGLVANYKKANRIYQATANIFNALQSIGYSILSALEVVGSYVALIGNALRKWGEVGESAYKWFNPQPNFHNKFFTTVEGVTNVVSQVDQVASEVVSVEQNIAQIGELKNELGKSIGEEDGSKQGVQPPEAVKVKAGFDADKLVSATGLAIADSDKEADD
ncbi:hypothetical protein [Nostoc sp. DSM 114167]|jgi:hypothetical protein|uniref:hypothetical protein n=1 Tax=Nostoc sp. DSM 114167 TaxID=3439050 RepID=UPI0040464AEA